MLLIPAIDIREGRCVRLFQGKYDEVSDYGGDPVAVAVEFEVRGAQRIHVVDLDRAVKDTGGNFDLIKNICGSVAIPVECGGGVRSPNAASDLIDAGAAEVIVGTVVIKDPEIADAIIQSVGSDRVQIGFDFSGTKLAVKGWKELVEGSIVDEINRWHGRGVQRFILTDITRDGTMEGPNIDAFQSIAEQTAVKITASGGVSKPEDIHQLQRLESSGVDRTISGKAVYEGTILIEDFV